MNSIKTLLAAAVAASAISAPAAMAEIDVAASATVANMYLWRGQDLGQGSAAVSGDVTVSTAGFYTGVWASSGDSTAGQEFDLYAGYGFESGDFSADISVWNYVYSGGSYDFTDPLAKRVDSGDNFGDLSEIIVTLGYGPVSVSYYDNIAGGTGYNYYTFSGELGQFSLTYGMTDTDGDDYQHIDLSYAYNDNFSLTLSQIIDDDAEDTAGELDSDLKVVVAYSLPF